MEFPENAEYQRLLGNAYFRAAVLAKADENLESYEEQLEKAREVEERLYVHSPMHADHLPLILHCQAELAWNAGDESTARSLMSRVIQLRLNAATEPGRDGEKLIELSYILRVAIPKDLRDTPEAVSLAERAVAQSSGKSVRALHAGPCTLGGRPNSSGDAGARKAS